MFRRNKLLIAFLIGLLSILFVAGCAMQPIALEGETSPVNESVTEPVTDEASSTPTEGISPFSAEILANLAYRLEIVGSDPIQLTDGVYEDTANRIFVNWIDTYALGELNGEPSAAVVLLANTGGSGTFTVLAVVQEREGEPANVTSLLLGDRLTMNWIAISNDEIVLDLVGQGPDEAMCCGTQRTLLSFALEDNHLVQVDGQIIGVQPRIEATQVITYMPTIVPEASQPGSCFTNAIGLGRADAWRCTTDDNQIHDPCFETIDAQTNVQALVCGADPITGERGFVLELTEPLPTFDPGELSQPWIVQLGDGTICSLLTGTVPGVGDQIAPYGCADEARSNLMQEFLIFEPFWYAQSVVFGVGDQGYVIHSSVRTPVATVWR
jgi:hypothetical protein